jgi:hypothetical protein
MGLTQIANNNTTNNTRNNTSQWWRTAGKSDAKT